MWTNENRARYDRSYLRYDRERERGQGRLDGNC
jgi:hypothetical protein